MERETGWVSNFSVGGLLSPPQILDRLNTLDAPLHPVTRSRRKSPEREVVMNLSCDNSSTCSSLKSLASPYAITPKMKKRSPAKTIQGGTLIPLSKSNSVMNLKDNKDGMQRVKTAPAALPVQRVVPFSALSYDEVDDVVDLNALATTFRQTNNIEMWNDGAAVGQSETREPSADQQQLPSIYSETPTRPSSSANSVKLFGSINSEMQVKVEKLIKQEFLIHGQKMYEQSKVTVVDDDDDRSMSSNPMSPSNGMRGRTQSGSVTPSSESYSLRRNRSHSSSKVKSPTVLSGRPDTAEDFDKCELCGDEGVGHEEDLSLDTSELSYRSNRGPKLPNFSDSRSRTKATYGDMNDEPSRQVSMGSFAGTLNAEDFEEVNDAPDSAPPSRPALASFSTFLGSSVAQSVAHSVAQSRLASPRGDKHFAAVEDDGSIATMVEDQHLSACVAIVRGRYLTGGLKSKQERPLETCEKKLFGSPYGKTRDQTYMERHPSLFPAAEKPQKKKIKLFKPLKLFNPDKRRKKKTTTSSFL